ncbi:MAG TPA: EAL domain-containing protein [Candidatus Baltobacteraceae bacterium]|nr:EAL domain-containing protein [Candidatus Baltobacteraceae bacterium]
MAQLYGAEGNAEILSLILKCLPAFVVAADANLRLTLIRGSSLARIGVDEQAVSRLIGTSAESLFAGPKGEPILRRAQEALAGESGALEIEWAGRWYSAHFAPLRDELAAIVGVVVVGMDFTPRQQLKEQLERERQLLEEAQQLAEVGSWVLDVQTGEVQISAQLARLLGVAITSEPIYWTRLLQALHPNQMEMIEAEKERALSTCGEYDFDHDVVRPDGTIRHVRSRGHVECDGQGRPKRCIGTMHDVTERVEAQRTIELLAYHDPLTGLPNRWLLHDRLRSAIASAQREGCHVFAVFIDLDDFKRINDSLGHAMGDVLLAEVAQRLERAARSSDTVARMGGDEFVVVLTHVDEDPQLEAVLKKLCGVFTVPFRLAESEYAITASFGVAGYPGDASSEGDLLRDADAAMYEAKQSGRNAVRRYSRASVALSKQRLQLEADLREAIRNEQFRVYYQPIAETKSLRITGVEALLRWEHPTRGLLLPGTFLPLIDHTDYAITIGAWVLRQACEDIVRWRTELGVALRLSVNVSGRQLQHDQFAALLAATLGESGLEPNAVDVEILENTVVHDLESAARVLAQVREVGVGVAIDDFGTGYNSLSYLKQFPVTALKIDRAFVSEMGSEGFDHAISSALIALGKALRIRVIAEGVEDGTQLRALTAMGCDEVQGYYVAPPMQARDLDHRLAHLTPR